MPGKIACVFLVPILSLAALPPDDAPAKKDLAPLQGVWKLVWFGQDGDSGDAPPPVKRWVIKGDKVHYGGEELATLTIDATTTPPTIDLAFLNPKKVLEGIYKLEKDTLTLCVNRQTDGAKERPLQFSTEGKPDLRLLVFARDKDAKGTEDLAGYIGISIQVDRKRKQVLIGNTQPGSPARKAGLKKGDILLKVGSQEVTELREVIDLVQQTKPGSKITLRIKRDGTEQDVTLKAGMLPFFLLD
jgi:uncharacterized protein (TIGR03067 family)